MPQTHDRVSEAHYFLHQVIDHYHSPDEMRWNLNAFLQSNRNTTFVLQSELNGHPGFAEWYRQRQEHMAADPLFKLMNEARVFVVHKGNLEVRSAARALVRMSPKTVMTILDSNLPLNVQTSQLMAWTRSRIPMDVPPEHEIGIQRLWRLEEIPDKEVAFLCADAWQAVSDVVKAAHLFLGHRFEPSLKCVHHFDDITTLWESDLTAEGRVLYAAAVTAAREEARQESLNGPESG